MLLAAEVRKKFIDFFKEKGHKIVPSSSLVPSDKTVLFTSAGMQQFLPYLTGQKSVLDDFGTRHLASYQKCLRTKDIHLVGDDTHHTFFEMFGNWSIGQDKEGNYFKEKAIEYALDFFCNVLGLKKERMWITVFAGGNGIPADKESLRIWQEHGIPLAHIRSFGMNDNFWGPVMETGPCGPCTEIHYDRGEKYGCGHPDCGPNCPRCQRFVELWNLVFMEYNKVKKKAPSAFDKSSLRATPEPSEYVYEKLPQKNVDTGIGFERLMMVLEDKPSPYETEIFEPLIRQIERHSSKSYNQQEKAFKILADHLRAVAFLVSDGILPSNLGRGYILRRILRRMIRYANLLGLKNAWYVNPLQEIEKFYGSVYPEVSQKEENIITVIEKERGQFERTLNQGMKQLQKLINNKLSRGKEKIIYGKEAFELYETYGFPLELTEELSREQGFSVERDSFQKSFRQHQEISRQGAQKKFGGHGLKEWGTAFDNPSKTQGLISAEQLKDIGEKDSKIIKLHTTTHLLQAALRQILGPNVKQMGSDINEERLRFDFSFSRKLTKEELREVENLVQRKIKEGLKVQFEEMALPEAIKSGALAFFKTKYPKVVRVYTIFNPQTGEIFSKEICAGPHVSTTSCLGHFKILKEKSSGSGVRRIWATLE